MNFINNFIEKLLLINDYEEFKKEFGKIILTGNKVPYSFLNLIRDFCKKKYNVFYLYNDINDYIDNNFFLNNALSFFYNDKQIDFFYFKYENKDNFLKFFKILKEKNLFLGYFDSYFIKNLKNEENAFYILNTDFVINNKNYFIFLNLYSENYKFYIQSIIENYKEINLDYFCLLMKYSPLIKQLFWKDYLIEIKKNNNNFITGNIFDLTNFFFQKNKEQFFNLWNLLNSEYLPEFWIPYFLEQLWLAYLYLYELKKTNKINNSYKKLCKWFMNNGYKNYSLEEIFEYYILLYKSNNNIKIYSIDSIDYLKIIFNKIFK